MNIEEPFGYKHQGFGLNHVNIARRVRAIVQHASLLDAMMLIVMANLLVQMDKYRTTSLYSHLTQANDGVETIKKALIKAQEELDLEETRLREELDKVLTKKNKTKACLEDMS